MINSIFVCVPFYRNARRETSLFLAGRRFMGCVPMPDKIHIVPRMNCMLCIPFHHGAGHGSRLVARRTTHPGIPLLVNP
jgi:hypothetical protein